MPRVKHVVLFRLKTSTSPAQVAELFSNLAGLREQIPGILDFSGGPNCSPEGLNKSLTHGFVMTFADEAARDSYLPHPAHEAVKQQIIPLLDGGIEAVTVLDWPERP